MSSSAEARPLLGSPSPRAAAPRPAAWTFAGYVALGVFLLIVVWANAGLVWTDLLHVNPHRSRTDVWPMFFLETPLVALLLTGFLGSLPSLFAALWVAVLQRAFRRVPVWSLPLIAATCTAATCAGFMLGDGPAGFASYAAASGAQNDVPQAAYGDLAFAASCLTGLYLLPLCTAWRSTRARSAHHPLRAAAPT